MTLQKLKEYLKTVHELEKTKYENELLMDNVKSINYEAKLVEPQKVEVKVSEDTSDFSMGFAMLGGITGAVIGFIIYLFAMVSFYTRLSFWVCVWLGFFAGLIIGTVIGTIMDGSVEKEESKKKTEIIAKNNAIEIETNRQNNRAIKIANQKNGIILNTVKELKNTHDEIEQTLEKLYSADVIHPKYRNLIAISSIYEYIDTGICTELTGPEGAYKLFELHVRLDKIITKMDIIIRNLERIAENQYYLYDAIKNMQPQIEQMAENIKANTDKLNEIAVSTEVTKHISKAIERNTAATAYAAQVTAYTAQVIERNQYYDRNSSNSAGLYDHIHMPKI